MTIAERTDYAAFLEAKAELATASGMEVDPADVNPILKPHQRDAVVWAIHGGRRAVFASFGLGKTLIQLEIVRLVLAHEGGKGLIVLPLGVRQEFTRDARMLGLAPTFIRTNEEAAGDGIYLTNYESVREGKLDPRDFTVVSLDEAAILRGFGGTKTFREFMRLYEGTARYRFVATATPSPNEYIELLAYAAFLDIMDVGQAKTRFFKRDSTKADKLTLLPHMEHDFWMWVASWALFIQKPSDLGYSDEGYVLPALDVRWHELPSTSEGDFDRHGRGRMFRNAALGVQEASREKRTSLDARVAKMRELVDADPGDHFLLWHDLEDERRAIEDALPITTYGMWDEYRDGHPDALALYDRHYSARQYADGRERNLFVGPGEKLVLLTRSRDALFAWRRFKDDSGQLGVNCAVFRNEGAALSSELVREAMAIGWARWPGERLYTYVDPEAIESQNPGYCFKVAGWRECGRTKGGHGRRPQVILEALPDWTLDLPELASTGVLRSVWGTQDLDERERRVIGFSDGEYRILAGKPVMLGSGCNFQRHCHRAIFVGNADAVEETARMADASVGLIVTSIPFATQYEYTPSYNDFGHTEDNDHFWEQMDYLTPDLLRVLEPGRVAAIHVKDRVVPGGMTGYGFQTVQPFHAEAIAHYTRHGFAFLGMKTIVTDVVRENNQTYRLGWTEQCKDGTKMGAGLPEYILLFRKPPTDRSNGYADVPVVKSKAGYSRSRWQIDAHGFARSNGNRPLIPEDLDGVPHDKIFRLFRDHNLTEVYDFEAHVALGEALEAKGRLPVTFMLLQPPSWHPDVWTDVARMRTLNLNQYQKGQAYHLCPLQFDIVDRLIVQFSNEGETVYDPFMGIGTVPMRALGLGRSGVGVELNPTYFVDAAGYCEAAAQKASMPTLFDLLALDEQDAAEVPA